MGQKKMSDDNYEWLMESVRILREGRFSDLDVNDVAGVLEDMGKAELRELESRIVVLMLHLLKWIHQPTKRKGGWEATIIEQRRRIKSLLRDSPSLESRVPGIVASEWSYVVRLAIAETGENSFPLTPSFSIQEMLSDDFLP
jgi:Domain of unknown function DUF29